MVNRSSLPQMMPSQYDVCCIGNAIVDVIAECDDHFLEVEGIVKGGMTLIDEERAAFLYEKVQKGIEMSGGSAGNTVTGIASLGGKPAYIGKIKNDQLGDTFRYDMKESGVHFITESRKDGPSTAQCIIFVTPDAQRSMNTYLGACVDLSSADIDQELIVNSQVTYLEGYLFDKPKAKEAFYLAAKTAHDANRNLSLTLSDTFCVDRHRDDFLKLVREEIDFLLANEYELMSLYQTENFEEAMVKASEHCAVVVGTRSEKGAVIMADDKTYVIKAESVPLVLDSTGAGDLFAAGFLFGVTQGYDLETSGRLGAMAAGEVISHYGPRPQRNLKMAAHKKGIN